MDISGPSQSTNEHVAVSVRSHGIPGMLPAQWSPMDASTAVATQVQVVFHGGRGEASNPADTRMLGKSTVVDKGRSSSVSTSAFADSVHRCFLEWPWSASPRWTNFGDVDNPATREPISGLELIKY